MDLAKILTSYELAKFFVTHARSLRLVPGSMPSRLSGFPPRHVSPDGGHPPLHRVRSRRHIHSPGQVSLSSQDPLHIQGGLCGTLRPALDGLRENPHQAGDHKLHQLSGRDIFTRFTYSRRPLFPFCTQSGTALNIRKYCLGLKTLILEIDSTDANGNAGLAEAMRNEDEPPTQNVWALQNQVQDLQSRLNTLQVKIK